MIFTQTRPWFESHGIGDCSGYAWPEAGIAVVCDDLGHDRTGFVAFHEDFHLRDEEANVLLRELKASGAAALRHPVGAIKELADALLDHTRRDRFAELLGKGLDQAGIDVDVKVSIVKVRF